MSNPIQRSLPVFFVLMFTAILCTAFNPPVFGMDKEQALSLLETKYAGKSFSTNFLQLSTLAALDITEKATGTAIFSHPGKMRWEYKTPEPHQVITDGKTLWIYRPEENQVMVGDAGQFFKSGAGGAFLSDISLIRKNYNIRIKKETDKAVVLNLDTKKKDSQITAIDIKISKANNEIVQVTTYNPYNDTTLFDFYNTRFVTADPQIFEFKIPKDVSVLDME